MTRWSSLRFDYPAYFVTDREMFHRKQQSYFSGTPGNFFCSVCCFEVSALGFYICVGSRVVVSVKLSDVVNMVWYLSISFFDLPMYISGSYEWCWKQKNRDAAMRNL
jgi:hypothetical protein